MIIQWNPLPVGNRQAYYSGAYTHIGNQPTGVAGAVGRVVLRLFSTVAQTFSVTGSVLRSQRVSSSVTTDLSGTSTVTRRGRAGSTVNRRSRGQS